jgi:hypothetical protein
VLILLSSASLPYPRPVLTSTNDRDSDSPAAPDPCSIPSGSAPPLRSRPLMLQSLARQLVADAMDFSADREPCDNFYRLACGGWLEKNNVSAIPPDVSSWSKSKRRKLQTGRSLSSELMRS